MAYDANRPADNSYIANGPGEIRENFRALKDDRIVNAGNLNGLTTGNASGNIPVNNGTVNVNLNAEKLQGKVPADFATATHGHITATSSSNGYMLNTDKVKLDGIANGAEVNQNAFSNVLVGSTTIQADSKTDTLTLTAGAGITLVPDATNDAVTIAVTANGHSHTDASTTASGFMCAADKSKLNGIAAGAEVNQNSFANVVAGGVTLVADSKTDTLTVNAGSGITVTGDATNDAVTISVTADGHSHSIATTSASGFMASTDKAKLDGIASGAEVNQNTFSNIKVGASTISADSKTDTLEIVAGTGVTLAADSTNDKVTISVGNHNHNDATQSAAGFLSIVDKAKLDGIKPGAEVNQNAFSNILVGTTTIVADGKTDTVELVGGAGITLTPDATNDRVTIAVADSGISSAKIADGSVSASKLSSTAVTDKLGYTPANKAGDTFNGVVNVINDGCGLRLQSANSGKALYLDFANTSGGEVAFLGYGSNGSSDFGLYNNNGKLNLYGSSGVYVASGSNRYKIWHEGNDGSGSGLDADLLDGIDSSRIIYGDNQRGTTEVSNINTIIKSGFYFSIDTTNNPTATTWHILHGQYSGSDSTAWQLAFADNADPDIQIREKRLNAWGSWRKLWHNGNTGTSGASLIGYTPANKAGDTFTGNVFCNGSLTLSSTNLAKGKLLVKADATAFATERQDSANRYHWAAYAADTEVWRIIDSNGTMAIYVNNIDTLRLTKTGNVLVGTSTDNGIDKLQVNGTINASGGYKVGNNTVLHSGNAPIASSSQLGMVKQGSGVTIDANGVISTNNTITGSFQGNGSSSQTINIGKSNAYQLIIGGYYTYSSTSSGNGYADTITGTRRISVNCFRPSGPSGESYAFVNETKTETVISTYFGYQYNQSTTTSTIRSNEYTTNITLGSNYFTIKNNPYSLNSSGTTVNWLVQCY